MNRAIKYRAYPTAEQLALFIKTCGCVRSYWNHALADSEEFLAAAGKVYIPTPAAYKKEFPYLKEVDSLALCNAQLNLKSAWHKCFSEKDVSAPKYKSRKKNNVTSYTTNKVGGNILLGKNSIKLPKMGLLHISKHRSPQNGWTLKSATVSMTAGKMYVSVLFDIKDREVSKKEITSETDILGLDYSMPKLYIDSNGNEPDYKHPYYKAQEKLAVEQRKFSKMAAGSHNREKQKKKIAAIQEKIANQRKEFCHVLSTQISNEYAAVAVEDLNLRGMAGALQFGKRVGDNGFGMFRRMLEYKLSAKGGQLIVIDKWYPSTQTCSNCGYIHSGEDRLSLEDRLWICPCCGTQHDRDINAALNIRNVAFSMIST